MLTCCLWEDLAYPIAHRTGGCCSSHSQRRLAMTDWGQCPDACRTLESSNIAWNNTLVQLHMFACQMPHCICLLARLESSSNIGNISLLLIGRQASCSASCCHRQRHCWSVAGRGIAVVSQAKTLLEFA
eukprot:1149505-Pelagomonas_calceolata.AAC.2